MDLRHTTGRKHGKPPTSGRLVRSVRVGAKVRQETVAQLGEREAAGRVGRAYRQLTEAAAACRVHKSDRGLRPLWHQKAERVQAPSWVCFLA